MSLKEFHNHRDIVLKSSYSQWLLMRHTYYAAKANMSRNVGHNETARLWAKIARNALDGYNAEVQKG